MDADIAWVKWFSEYDQWEFDPTSKVGKGLCSAPGCTSKAVLVEETPDKGSTIFGSRKRGLCLSHAQTLLRGYWTPGMAVVTTPDDVPASKPGRTPRNGLDQGTAS